MGVSYPFVYFFPIGPYPFVHIFHIPLRVFPVGQITCYLVDFNRLPFYT